MSRVIIDETSSSKQSLCSEVIYDCNLSDILYSIQMFMLSIKNKIRTSCVVQAPKYAKDESTALFLYVSCKRAHSHRFPPESFIFMFTTSFSHQAPTVTTDIWLPLFFITYGHNTSCTSSKRLSFSCIIKNQFSSESGKAPQTRILKCHFCLSMPSCWNDWINAVPGMIFLFFTTVICCCTTV